MAVKTDCFKTKSLFIVILVRREFSYSANANYFFDTNFFD